MAETFDPDKFLAQTKPFSPDAFLGQAKATQGGPVIPAELPPRTPDKPEQRTAVERLGEGFMDPVYGAARIGARIPEMPPEGGIPPESQVLSPEEREKRIAIVDDVVRRREQEIQKRAGSGIDWWRLVGEGSNPMQYAPALMGGLAGAAASGMMSAALHPVTEADFYDKKVHDMTWGMAFGAGVGAITNVAGRAVSPIVGRAAQELLDRNVELTPGRLAGQLMSRMEDAARSIPPLGWFIRNAADRSNRTYNIAAGNAVLDPLGLTVPRQIEAGRPMVEYLEDTLRNQYDQLLSTPGLAITPTHSFLNDMANIRTRAMGLGHNLDRTYENRIHQAVGIRLLGGQMTGQQMKDAESELGQLSARYGKSTLASERDLGELFGEAQQALRAALQDQHPQIRQELAPLNQAYAMFKRVQNASQRRAGSGKDEGVFTPMDLAAAAKTKDISKDKAAFARGDAIMQEFAEWGLFVMPQRLPDSGTTERALWGMLGLGGVTAPATVAALALKAAPAVLPYVAPITRGLNRVARGSAGQRAFRAGTQATTPFVGAPAEEVFRFDGQGNRAQ